MVAPGILADQDTPSDDDCHLYVLPVLVVAPARLSKEEPEAHNDGGVPVTVPGDEVQSGAPAKKSSVVPRVLKPVVAD